MLRKLSPCSVFFVVRSTCTRSKVKLASRKAMWGEREQAPGVKNSLRVIASRGVRGKSSGRQRRPNYIVMDGELSSPEVPNVADGCGLCAGLPGAEPATPNPETNTYRCAVRARGGESNSVFVQ